MDDLTILIVARDAESTIERCVRSALAQGGCRLLLVDDCSGDATVERARRSGGRRLQVVSLAEHRTLGHARQRGLEAVETPYCMLLDADDELLPGRAARLREVLARGDCELVADEVLLWDAATDAPIREMRIPGFLGDGEFACRLFERNYLPGIGQIAFRTERIQKIGYDETLHGPEDTDLVLRALLGGCRLRFVREIGYKMYHYEGSVSRDLDRQNQQLANALRKHDLDAVARLYRDAGYAETIVGWMRVMLSVFRQEITEAERYLDALYPEGAAPDVVLEPDGPCPLPERWRYLFCKGALRLKAGDAAAARSRLEAALDILPNAETLNNLGVAEAAAGGNPSSARRCFVDALDLYPDFSDARRNLASEAPRHVTLLPLRTSRTRDRYC